MGSLRLHERADHRQAILGRSVVVTVGRTCRNRFEAASAQAARGETFRAELPYFVGDGSERIADVTIQPIRDDAGHGPVPRADRHRHHRPEKGRGRRALRQPWRRDLSEADRRKNEFLAMLAHELRNPLAPISNAARALRLGGSDGDSLRSASDMLERQVSQMSRLVDDLLDMSRITRGRIELRKEPLELAPIVSHAVEAVRALVSQHGSRTDRHPAAAADASRRRPDAARAGDRQPAEQRQQVHRQGRPRLADGREGRQRRRSSACATTASASPPSTPGSARCSRRSIRRWSARATDWASA